MAKRNLKTLSDAGVRIAMGTDTGPAGRWQGFFEHLELEMMVQSGMTPMQVIVASTSAAADCHGKGGQFGALTPGRVRRSARAQRQPAGRHPEHAADQEHLHRRTTAAVAAYLIRRCQTTEAMAWSSQWKTT